MKNNLEQVDVAQEKKKTPPVLKVHSIDYITGTPEEIEKAEEDALAELRSMTPDQIIEMETDRMKNFIAKVTKTDREIFSEVTGYNYNEQVHHKNTTNSKDIDIMMSGLQIARMSARSQHNVDLFGLSHLAKSKKHFDLEMAFGFKTLDLGRHEGKDVSIFMGMVGIDDVVADELEKYNKRNELMGGLKNIMDWFNHDITSHGSFMPYELGEYIGVLSPKDAEFVDDIMSEDFSHHNAPYAFESWAGVLHKDIFEKMKSIRGKGVIVRFIKQQAGKYLDHVERLAATIKDPEWSASVREYLIRLYGFALLRIVDPQEFAPGGDFDILGSQYPELASPSRGEREYQMKIHGQEGGITAQGRRYTHEEIFDRWHEVSEKLRMTRYVDRHYNRTLSGVLRDPEEIQQEHEYLVENIDLESGRYIQDRMSTILEKKLYDVYGITPDTVESDRFDGATRKAIEQYMEKHQEDVLRAVVEYGIRSGDFFEFVEETVVHPGLAGRGWERVDFEQ